MRNAIFLVTALTALAAGVRAEDWPTFMHDNQRTGVTAESLRPPLQLQWSFQSPAPPSPGWALPVNGYGARKNKPNVSHDDAFRVVAVGDTCYFCSSAEDRVVAVDAVSGAVRWTFFADAAPRLAPAVSGGKLYVGADDGVFRCLDAAGGDLLWQVNAAPIPDLMLGHGRFSSVWPIRGGGLVEDGIAYFSAGLFPYQHLYLWAVDANTGALVLRRQLDRGGRGAHAPQGYILSTADSLFTTSRIAPSRWNKSDGRPVDFNTPFPQVENSHEYRFLNGGSNAQILNGKHIVFGQACILAYDPDAEWKDRWGKPKKGGLLFNWFNARQAVFRKEMAYLATDYHLLAVRQDLLPQMARGECREFEQAYKKLRIAGYLDLLERHARMVKQFGSDHPRVKSLEQGPLKWGREGWLKWPEVSQTIFAKMGRRCAWMTPVQATECLILAGDILYAGGEDRVYAIDVGGGKILWQAATGSRVRGLVVANGRLFVSTIDGQVRCFAKPGQTAHADGTAPTWGRLPACRQAGSLSHDRAPRRLSDNLLAARPKGPAPDAALADTARRIVELAGVRRGYCLIIGGDRPGLAAEIARLTELRIELCTRDRQRLPAMRQHLARAGLYGSRVCVRHGDTERLPYPPYVFNLVVDQGALSATELTADVREQFRVTKPCGGVLVLGGSGETIAASLEAASLDEQNAARRSVDDLTVIVRGPLPRSRDWTHNYASPANTYCSGDPLVKGPFGVLWYGEPGPRRRIERHATPPMPLVVGGRVYTIGYDRVMAFDVYNGTLYWEREIEGATRAGLPINTSNLAAGSESLFLVVANRKCLRLAAESGRTIRTYEVPPIGDQAQGYWAWIAVDGNRLFGSRAELDERRRRPREQTSDAVFAVSKQSGKPLWSYRGRGIDHDGIALDDGKVFLTDRTLSAAERTEAISRAVRDTSVPDREAVDRRGDPIPRDVRKLVVLNATTGTEVWQKPLDVTDVTLDDAVVQGRGGVACMVHRGVLLVHGTGSLGHPHREFLEGKFSRRAMYAFDAGTGRYLWGGRKGYRKRPIVVGDYVYAEPFAWHLRTGDIKLIDNPLSGRPQVFDFHRGYIGCGHVLASGSALFGARGGIAYSNLDQQRGFTPFAGMALACGIGATPANGVFVVPEGRSGCTCDTPIYTSIALHPKPSGSDWGISVAGGRTETKSLPVKHLCVNLGAPGYREDSSGHLWVPYPARVDTGPLGSWLPTYQHTDDMCFRLDELHTDVAATNMPWVFASGYRHDKPLRFRLCEADRPPAKYAVKLYFAEPDDLQPGDRVFSVLLQGQTVLENFDIRREAGGPRIALTRQFTGIEVSGELEIQLVPAKKPAAAKPILCGFEVVRQ